MSIKNILVAYNGLPGSEAALSGAVLMQQYFDAHITGLFAHGNPFLSRQMNRTWMPRKVQEAIMEAADSPTPMCSKSSTTSARMCRRTSCTGSTAADRSSGRWRAMRGCSFWPGERVLFSGMGRIGVRRRYYLS